MTEKYSGLSPDHNFYLIKKIYSDFARFKLCKEDEIMAAIDRKNPFWERGSAHTFIHSIAGVPKATVSAIIDSSLPGVGILGFFEAEDHNSGISVIFEAADHFKERGISKIIGPMNLHALGAFRVSYPESEEPFFSEPFGREYYGDIWRKSGFITIQKNISTEALLSARCSDPKQSFLLDSTDFFLKPIDMASEASVKDVALIINECFCDSPFFVPATSEMIKYSFAKISEYAAGFSRIAYSEEGVPAGLVFAFPDVLNEDKKRIVIKTLAVRSIFSGKGLGKYLLGYAMREGLRSGAERAIFSTMRNDNAAILKMTNGERMIRNYELFGSRQFLNRDYKP